MTQDKFNFALYASAAQVIGGSSNRWRARQMLMAPNNLIGRQATRSRPGGCH